MSHTTKRGYTRLIVRSVSTDKETVERASRLAGVGRVYGPYQYGDRQPSWQWAITRRKQSEEFMHRIRPLMGTRRQGQIDRALEIGAAK